MKRKAGGWLVTTLLIPNKPVAGGRTPPAFAGKSKQVFPQAGRQAGILHLIIKISKKKCIAEKS